MSDAKIAAPFALPPGLAGLKTIPKWSLEYYKNSMTVTGAILALLGAPPLVHFFGVWILAPWLVTALSLLLLTMNLGYRALLGEKGLGGWLMVAHGALVGVWMATAVAYWTTGNPAAWALGLTIATSWVVHVIFTNRGDMRVTMLMLAICAVPTLGFLLYVCWTSYPAWVAVSVTISAIAMVASILASARMANRLFNDLQNALTAAAASRARLEFAIDGVGDGYFEYDIDNDRHEPNARLSRHLGYDDPASDMRAVLSRIHPDDMAETVRGFAAAKSGAESEFDRDVRLLTKSGEIRWMNVRARLLVLPGEPRRLIGTMVDLTHRKKLEDDLRAAIGEAEASNKAKSEFLANMSHEIRTPLNGVLGMAQALEADDMPSAQREKVSIILDSGKSLMALLNDVLDLSKIEAGKLEISTVPGDFLHTMKRTRQLFQTQAEDKGLDLSVRYDSSFPQRLTYDPVRVRQCVSNMLSNAIKFTAKGRVEVSINATKHADGGHMVSVEVTDTGIGMNPEVQAKLFSAFTQADGATTRQFGGSGLGLAISRQLARLMGGDMTVTSEVGRGSCFRLTFRAGEAAPEVKGAPAPSLSPSATRTSLRGVRVLLTDDNAINRQVVKLFLAPQGCEIVEATNGKEALDKVSSEPFDIVLLDVHMPVMDGKEAIQRLRAAKQDWSRLPVIALTADAMSGDREKYLALGMTDYVSKPVDQRELIAKMHQVLGLSAAAPGVAKAG